MLRKMGLGIFGGVQVSNNVKYYGMNKKTMRGNVPHFHSFVLVRPLAPFTALIFIVKLNLGRCLIFILHSFRINHFAIQLIVLNSSNNTE